MAFSNTSFTPKKVRTLVSKYDIPISLAAARPEVLLFVEISYCDDIIILTLIRHDNVFLLNLSVIIFSL